MMKNNRKLALITGASGGIGEYLAYELAGDGHDLCLVARSKTELQRVAAAIGGDYAVETNVIALDLAKPRACERLEKTLAMRDLSPDLVVNNAGFGLSGEAAGLSREEQLEMIDLNIRVLTDLSLRFVGPMRERGGGGILNVASVAGFLPGPYMAVYYATKAFVLSFTESLSNELAGAGITVSVLCPGPTDTGFFERSRRKTASRNRAARMMSAQSVAKIGYRDFKAGKVVAVPGTLNKIITLIVRVAPRAVARAVTAKVNR